MSKSTKRERKNRLARERFLKARITEEKGYDLKDSTSLVGQLYPILKAADGEILDGRHRSEADRAWRTKTLSNIDTPEKKLASRLISNIHRRNVPKTEKEIWINELAALYLKQGLMVERKTGTSGQGVNEITKRIIAITGLSKKTVTEYLKDCYKQMSHSRGITQHKCVAPAAEVIVNILNSHSAGSNPGYGDRLLERYKQELLKSPLFRAEILSSIPTAKSFHYPINDMEVTGLPENVYQDKDGILHQRKLKDPQNKKPKGESYFKPIKESYFEMFIKDCPSCQCADCPHANQCIERVREDEPISITVFKGTPGVKFLKVKA